MTHSHADERRKRSLDEQLDGASLFEIEPNTMPITVPAAPEYSALAPVPMLRVSRRTLTQDRAFAIAAIAAPTHAARIVARLRSIYPNGETRDELALKLDILLQSVCSSTNRMLKADTPAVYENGTREGKNVLYAYPFLPDSLTPEDSASVKED